jgi:hypothetical protein
MVQVAKAPTKGRFHLLEHCQEQTVQQIQAMAAVAVLPTMEALMLQLEVTVDPVLLY